MARGPLRTNDMPHVLAVIDRIHLAQLGRRAAVLNPNKISISDSVAVMTGAIKPEHIPVDCLAR